MTWMSRQIHDRKEYRYASFAGASKNRVGRFGAANGETRFLDEIGEIPLDLQCELFHGLQEKQYERVAEDRTKPVDGRIIAATNQPQAGDCRRAVSRGSLLTRGSINRLRWPESARTDVRATPSQRPVSLFAVLFFRATLKIETTSTQE
jgi:transcriptional regulator of aromatic amino acid metabolism